MNQYDFIIVGAGAAGCLLANRLSANPMNSVLLIETRSLQEIQQRNHPEYQTEPVPELQKRRIEYRKYHGDFVPYARGHWIDFESWELGGNKGWRYQDVLPYFRRFERFSDCAALYGKSDELQIIQHTNNKSTKKFLSACHEMGWEYNQNIHTEATESAGMTWVLQNHQRVLKPISHRTNLTIQYSTNVQKIIFEAGRAAAIEYQTQQQPITIQANQEIILCCGTINSAKLLMLSGIGPAIELMNLGIPIQFALPGVGKNLQDHIFMPIHLNTQKTQSPSQCQRILEYWKHKLLTSKKPDLSITEATALVCSNPYLSAPDLEITFTPNCNQDFTLQVVLLQPRSQGKISLQSANSSIAPRIIPAYLESELDQETMIKGVEIARAITKTKEFAMHVPQNISTQSPQTILDDIREQTQTLYRPVGTCRMGEDKFAVVDEKLRVHGVRGLRIADASVMPKITRGHIEAPTMMIAERAADFILAT
jgi:choline dehydrogenase